ncbi:MAG: S-layer homology domain-containing protein [Candidatus Margulisbacteria bacterium]|nr:S-layer homology domain-containing protein [Candidatus Margulisiibacteriota bacterium]
MKHQNKINRGLSVIIFFVLVLISSASGQVFTDDPVKIGVGARPMGMGKAFVAVSDDGSGILMNPAGISHIKSWIAFSMYSNLFNEVQYLTLTYSTPFSFLNQKYGFGFAAVRSGITNIPSPSQFGLVYFDYHNDVYLLSLSYPINEALSAGLNYKIFDQGFTGGVSSLGTGHDIDLGVKYTVSDRLVLGLNLQNILPFDMGGRINWDYGYTEGIPAVAKIGAALTDFEGRLLMAVDYDMWLTRKASPAYHAGLEWELNPMLTVRAGLDQNFSSTATNNGVNPTLGLGFYLSGFRFDYAYHPYYAESSNVTHFFSLSYTPPQLSTGEAAARKEVMGVTIGEPADKSVVYQDRITIGGFVLNNRIRTVAINDKKIPIGPDNMFETEEALALGKNVFTVAGLDAAGKTTIEAQSLRILRLANFPDVSKTYWAKDAIEQVATLGFLETPAGKPFGPDKTVRRADVLKTLIRLSGISLPREIKSLPFKDIGLNSWLAPYLKAAYDAGLITAGPDRKFNAARPVTRLESIVMMVRFSKFALPKVQERPFADLSVRHWAIKEITAAKQEGLLEFATINLYPSQQLTRAEFAYMLSKTPMAAPKIKELLKWE